MIFLFLRALLRITNRFYFKTLQVRGSVNIPKTGPIVFVANHPSTFMDPIVIGTVLERPVYFLGKGVLFNSKFAQWLLPKFNIIPLFRKDETPGQAQKNKDTFALCHKHLANQKALLIFPEGVSLTERKIKKIQSGTARICLGAEAENNFGLDIQIVTIGLNYSDPHKFQSELFVNIDKPLKVSDYYEAYKQDSFKAAHALTDEIRKRLETQVIAIQNNDVDKFVSNIETIFKAQILQDLGHSPKVMEHDFNTTKQISDSVHYFLERDPERVERMKLEINSYFSDLKRLSLNDDLLKKARKSPPISKTLGSIFFLLAGLPIFLFGIINNFLPYKIPGWLASALSKRREFYGAISMSIGTFTFPIFYAVQIWIASKYIHDWRVLTTYGILLPITGIFSYHYYKRSKTIRGNWKIFSMFLNKTTLLTSLISKRQSIISGLEKAREEYVHYRDNVLTKTI